MSKKGQASRPSVGQTRAVERRIVSSLHNPNVALPNPTATPPFDRMRNQQYENKVKSLGLAPNTPSHLYEILRGDAGAGSSIFRRATLFQRLAETGDRVAETPYSKAIQLATMRSTDDRPRSWAVSLLGVGRVIETDVPIQPLSDDEILATASGIPQGVTIPGPFEVARGVPLISTTKFRIMVHDESGQRFFDVDCMGTRSLSVYGWGVTVFALIKEDGYEVDRLIEQEPLSGMLDQTIAGARIIPIRTNFTQNPNNRTVTINQELESLSTIIPIPPGSKTVQVYCLDGPIRFTEYFVAMSDIDPLNPGVSGVLGTTGVIDPEPGQSHSSIYRIANANSIIFIREGENETLWSVVFGETP